MIYRTICLMLATLLTGQFAAADDLSFQANDLQGNPLSLKRDQGNLTVVCFLGTECPLARLYADRLNQLAEEFPSVSFVGICSNQQDSIEELLAYQTRYKVSFALIKDDANQIADQFGAERTPEVFLVDRNLDVIYRGRIDDQYQPGIAKAKPNRRELHAAISESLAGKPVSVARTQPDGCLIGRVSRKKIDDGNGATTRSDVTFHNQVSRILQNHCLECHRAGEIGPMELSDFDEVKGWGDMIVEVVDQNRMPPWHADSKHGEFANERRMTEAEKQMLRDWVEAGMPEGNPSDAPPVENLQRESEWKLPRAPDAVFEMREKPFLVPASGTVEYQYFVVDPGFTEDKWVTAAEILPGNRSVVHHSIVFVRPPDGSKFRGIGWLTAYVPGQGAPAFNPKYGRRIPAGSRLVFQQHYTPTGTPTEDVTRIGLVFGDEQEIDHELITLVGIDQEFVIPPRVSDFEVSGMIERLPEEGKLISIAPHMHYRGKSFRMLAATEKGEVTLLNVPQYDFNWQHDYQFTQPISLEEIQSLRFVTTFDNSGQNPSNPNPDEYVGWGDQTWEEMALTFANVAEPRNRNRPRPSEPSAEEKLALEKAEQELQRRVDEFVDRYFDRFDTNKDGLVTMAELPRATRRYRHSNPDANADGAETRAEVAAAARVRFQSER